MLTDDQIKGEAWNYGVETEGTKVIFQERLSKLKSRINTRDFLSLIVPIAFAFTYQTDWIQWFPNLKIFFLSILGVMGLFQTLMAAWSLVSKWDEERSYCLRAVRDSEEMRRSWTDLAKGIDSGGQSSFTLLKKQQDLIDSHDVQKQVTPKEKQIGMRHGLISLQRRCVCGVIPTSHSVPWRPQTKCATCGGN